MSFLEPSAITGTLLLGPLVLLYFMKLRRSRHRVSSTFLWKEVISDLQVNTLFSRFVRNLILLFQVLVLLLLIFSLMRPGLETTIPQGQNFILVLDASRSMKAGDIGPSRFDAARRWAIDFVHRAGRDHRIMLVSAGGEARMLSRFTRDKKHLTDMLKALSPDDSPGSLRDAVNLSLRFIKAYPEVFITVISDGSDPYFTGLKSSPSPQLDFKLFNGGGGNVAVTRLAIRPWKEVPSQYQGFVRVDNFSPNTYQGTLHVTREKTTIFETQLAVDGMESETFTFDGVGSPAGRYTASISGHDCLPEDDRTYFMIPEPISRIRIVGVTPNPVLEFGLKAVTGFSPLFIDTGEWSGAESGPDTLTVFLDSLPKDFSFVPGSNVMIINPPAGNHILPGAAANKPAKAIIWNETSPILRHVNLEELMVDQAVTFDLPPWARVAAESSAGPLIMWGEPAGARVVVVTFDLLRSDWPLRIGWPVFLANAVRWYSRQSSVFAPQRHDPGKPLMVAVPESTKTVMLREPGGSETELAVNNGSVLIEKTADAGFYTMSADGIEQSFVVAAWGQEEADLSRKHLVTKGRSADAALRNVRSFSEIWRYFAIAALLLLLLEWFIYHRRIFT